MKSFLYFTLIVAVLALGFVAFKAEAAPISWDYASGVLQPLQAAWSAQVKGSYFTATSTTASTFPYASTTAISASTLSSGNCVQASTGGLLTTTGAPCGSGSGTVTQINTTWPIIGGPITTTGTLTFGGLGTSTAAVVGNIPYFSGVNTFANVATTSVSSGTGISFSGTAGALVGGSNLTVTNSSPLSGLSASFPFSFSNPTLSWLGLGTSSPGITAGQPIYATGVNTIASVASSTFLTSIGGQTAGNYITALTGDVTASGPGSAAATLATVNSSVGSFGSATQTGTFTVNGKGLVTAASNVTITPALSSITGFGTGWATTLGNNVGASSTVLTSNGTNGVWQTIATGGITAIGPTGQTQTGPTITLATSSTPFNGLTASTTITGSGNTLTFANTMAGLLGVGGGGTGQSSYTTGDLLYASGSSALSKLSIGTGGYVLAVSNGVPAWVATSSITGAVSSVSNSDGTLTISPTTGVVVASLALGHANTWSAIQTFGAGTNVTSGQNYSYNGSSMAYAVTAKTDWFFANAGPGFSLTGTGNVGVGSFALNFLTSGANNTAVGNLALSSSFTGIRSSAFGANSLENNTSATDTVAVGYAAAAGALGSYSNQGSTAVGFESGFNFTTGSDYNTLLGYQSGYDITSGANNVILGTEQTTGSGITSGSNNILIGKGVRLGLTSTASNQLNIGNLIFGTGLGSENTAGTGNIGIASSSPGSLLSIGSTAGINFLDNATSTFQKAIKAPCFSTDGTTCLTSGAVSSVSNSDSSLTISPTTGAVVASLNVGHANTWSALQQFANATTTILTVGNGASGNTTLYIAGQQDPPTRYAGITAGSITGSDKTFTLPNVTGTFALGTGAANRLGYWSGTNTLTSSASLTFDGTTLVDTAGNVGVGSSTPFALLGVNAAAGSWPFAVGSSTLTNFAINPAGQIVLTEERAATTTAYTLDWAVTHEQVLYQTGTSATTVTLINATTTMYVGSRKMVVMCNPASGTAGALTWVGVEWAGGTTPTQTTTAKACDVYSFFVTAATSTSASPTYKVFGAASTGFL